MYVMSGPCMQKSRLLMRLPLVVLVLGNVEFVMSHVTPMLLPGSCNPNDPPPPSLLYSLCRPKHIVRCRQVAGVILPFYWAVVAALG
jgi:hypothetical protein